MEHGEPSDLWWKKLRDSSGRQDPPAVGWEERANPGRSWEVGGRALWRLLGKRRPGPVPQLRGGCGPRFPLRCPLSSSVPGLGPVALCP